MQFIVSSLLPYSKYIYITYVYIYISISHLFTYIYTYTHISYHISHILHILYLPCAIIEFQPKKSKRRSLHNIAGGFGSIICAFPTDAQGEILQVPEVSQQNTANRAVEGWKIFLFWIFLGHFVGMIVLDLLKHNYIRMGVTI